MQSCIFSPLGSPEGVATKTCSGDGGGAVEAVQLACRFVCFCFLYASVLFVNIRMEPTLLMASIFFALIPKLENISWDNE